MLYKCGSFYHIWALASHDCSKQRNRIKIEAIAIPNSHVNIQKSTSNVYIFTYYIYSTQIVIIYSISISINVFTSNFYLANEFFSNFTPARTAIYPILSRFEPLQLASSVRVYRVIGGGRRGEDNASGTTYFTQCLHPCRVSVWSRIHVSVFVAGYSSAIEIVLSLCCFWIVRWSWKWSRII